MLSWKEKYRLKTYLFLEKNNDFSVSKFRNRVIKILRLIRIYRNNPNDYNFLNDLTKLRSEYQDAELTLFGIGKEYIETPEMAMLKTYFIRYILSILLGDIFSLRPLITYLLLKELEVHMLMFIFKVISLNLPREDFEKVIHIYPL